MSTYVTEADSPSNSESLNSAKWWSAAPHVDLVVVHNSKQRWSRRHPERPQDSMTRCHSTVLSVRLLQVSTWKKAFMSFVIRVYCSQACPFARMQMLRSRKWNTSIAETISDWVQLSPAADCIFSKAKHSAHLPLQCLNPLWHRLRIWQQSKLKQWNLFQYVFNCFHVKALLLFIHLAPLSATYAKTMAPKQSPFKFVSNLSLRYLQSPNSHNLEGQEQAFLWRHISFCLELHLCVWLARLCLTLTISFLPHEKSSVFHSGFYICQSC